MADRGQVQGQVPDLSILRALILLVQIRIGFFYQLPTLLGFQWAFPSNGRCGHCFQDPYHIGVPSVYA